MIPLLTRTPITEVIGGLAINRDVLLSDIRVWAVNHIIQFNALDNLLLKMNNSVFNYPNTGRTLL